MIFDRRRVDEDLEKIRRTNLPHLFAKEESKALSEPTEKIGAKDIFAMIVAVFSIVLPYVLGFIGILGALMVVFIMIFG